MRDFAGATPDLDPTQLISPASNDDPEGALFDVALSEQQSQEALMKQPPEESECTTWRAYYEVRLGLTTPRYPSLARKRSLEVQPHMPMAVRARRRRPPSHRVPALEGILPRLALVSPFCLITSPPLAARSSDLHRPPRRH